MSTTNTTPVAAPKVGDGATIGVGSDRYPATVIWVSPSGHQAKVQYDSWKRTDHRGQSEQQEYEITPNPTGRIELVTRRANGKYQLRGGGSYVHFGRRSVYQDPHF